MDAGPPNAGAGASSQTLRFFFRLYDGRLPSDSLEPIVFKRKVLVKKSREETLNKQHYLIGKHEKEDPMQLLRRLFFHPHIISWSESR